MDNASGHTITLANSIIGVSILAMPYCFRQCGILLSICLLLISSIISRLACHFLLKSAIISRRKTFEFLAFHIFGSLGKFAVEIGMIGFLLGTCVAFFVVMGDLGPAILSEMTGVNIGNALRNSTLVALAFFCVLPLGLLRNVDSLNSVSTATIGFYCFLALKIVIEALPHIFTGDWVREVELWRPEGILQCLPIFSMALFCQTQLFEIYQAIPNASLDKMNGMVRVAVNICTWVYIFVGAFGYIAFFQKPFSGNILISFHPSIVSDVIKMGFVLSLAFSFPLVIFPCRGSLYSLLYKGTSYTNLHDPNTTNYIPEGKFKLLTVIIVGVSLLMGVLIPSIELVLGLIGSTIGVMICVIFPVTCFICVSPKNTNERILAQAMLFIGVIVMVLGTYANLQAVEEAQHYTITENIPIEVPKLIKEPEKIIVATTVKAIVESKPDEIPQTAEEKREEAVKDVRHEPPQPEEPVEVPLKQKTDDKQEVSVKKEEVKPVEEVRQEPVQPEERIKEEKAEKKDQVDIEAIKKEESELKEQEKTDKQQLLIETIQKHNEVHQEMVEQQKKLLEVLQKQQETLKQEEVDKVNEEKVKAVKEIEDIAKKAIESIRGQDVKDEKKAEIKNDNKTVDNVREVNLTADNKGNQSIVLVPLPIALAKLNNKSNEENAKAMRREILSEPKARSKREVEELSRAVKDVCEEMKKVTTEKPLIKMLCKLSEPGLVEPKLELANEMAPVETGRDLKL